MLVKPTTCVGCPCFGNGTGFVPSEGNGSNGVLIVLEAAGAEEAAQSRPVVGTSGLYLWTALNKINLQREDFRIHNVLSCQPLVAGFKANALAGMPYEAAAIKHCSPNLDATIAAHKAACIANSKHQVILTLGVIAFKRVMDLDPKDPMLKADYHGYVHWSQKYQCWVIASWHPSYLMRGNHKDQPSLLFAAQRAVEIAADGFKYDTPTLLLDPPAPVFHQWAQDYKAALLADPDNTYLSIDIETPKKAKAGEDELAREDEEDYIILRCSFAYRTDQAVSVPWTAEYMPIIESLFRDVRNQLVGWNLAYDIPRIKNQLAVRGTLCDGMLWWHVLQSALDKRLGFVTPYYWQRAKMWKHLSQREPAYYNSLDALAALINILGIKRDLEAKGQWPVIEEHVVKLGQVLDAMSAKGLRRDEAMRLNAENELTTLLQTVETSISAVVPDSAKKLKVYKTKPKKLDGVKTRIAQKPIKHCSICNITKPKKDHFKLFKKKVNACATGSSVEILESVNEFYKEIEWKPSKVSLTAYQKAVKQKAVWNRQKGTTTFDEEAIRKLRTQYPSDPLYPLILDHRRYQKLRGTYIGITQADGRIQGGLQVSSDGRIRPEYTMNPSTLRLACQNPNAQNLPRAGKDDLESIVRNLIVASPGFMLAEADYAAIEAVLSAYFARWRNGIRLAKLGVHSYLSSHVLGRPADLSWSDADLKAYFAEIKGSKDARTIEVYNGCKRAIHLCLTPEHEVFTTNGWVKFDQLQDGQKVAQWSPDGTLSFVAPLHVTRELYEGDMIAWKGRSVSAIMTPEHRIPTVDSHGKFTGRTASTTPWWCRIPTTGKLESSGLVVEDVWIKLAVAIQADASMCGSHARFHMVKQRKRTALKELLNTAQMTFKAWKCSDHADGEHFDFDIKGTPIQLLLTVDNKSKTFNLLNLLQLSIAQRLIFLDELPWWDGFRSGGKSGRQTGYCSTSKDNAEIVQTIAHISGRQAILRSSSYASGFGSIKHFYKVSFNARQFSRTPTSETTPYNGLVYCVTVPTGWFIVKHNNQISITGNSNYGGTPRKMVQADPETFPTVAYATKLQGMYFEVASPIRKWQLQTQLEAHTNGYLKNPWGYIHHFNQVFHMVHENGDWVRKPGGDANAVLAFLPQSTAAAILKDAMIDMFYNFSVELGQYLRLQVHDSLLSEVPIDKVEECLALKKQIMTAPIQKLPLPESYGFGPYLTIDVDSKIGERWGAMK